MEQNVNNSVSGNNTSTNEKKIVSVIPPSLEKGSDPEFVYLNEDDEKAEIFTKTYANGHQVKKVILKSGEIAIIRQLKGRDVMEINKRAGVDKDADYLTHSIAVATTIDGKEQPAEYYLDELMQFDYSKISSAYASLNFQ